MGRPTRVWGATYPVAYEYDAYGRMTALKTYRQEGGAADVTTWIYDQATGLLTSKLYADGNGLAYNYDALGRLAQRTWARGVTTVYGYDSLGQLTGTTYSDGTPAISFTYDRLGRKTQAITVGVSTNTFAYDAATLSLNSETQGSGFAAKVLTRTSDTFGHPAGISFGPDYSVGYGYDAYARFASVSSSVQSVSAVANYSYLPGSDLIVQLATDSGPLTTRTYEPNRDLITAVVNTFGGSNISSFAYANDVLGRRTARIDSASVTNIFGYNARGEMTRAAMGANSYGQYDAIGNRQVATNNAEVLGYSANALNQYTQISDGSVITLTYDSDGNMTTNGVWAYTWDAENRLVSAASNGVTVVQNLYDHQSRRIAKITSTSTAVFLYDGWNLVRELITHDSSLSTHSYVWGLDLSGSLQSAGGVGGLLARVDVTGAAYYKYDANGNVSELVAADGSIAAHYEYNPFGNLNAKSGILADAIPFRFSTKYFDAETGLYYYGYRHYSPTLGRWLSLDPIGVRGGAHCLGFVGNNPISLFDEKGLSWPGNPFPGDPSNYPTTPPTLLTQAVDRREKTDDKYTRWVYSSGGVTAGSCRDAETPSASGSAACLAKPIQCVCSRKHSYRFHTWTEIRGFYDFGSDRIPDVYPVLIRIENDKNSDPITDLNPEEKIIQPGSCMFAWDPPGKSLQVCIKACNELNK